MAALVEDVAQVLKLNPEGLTEKELPETLETRTASESFTDTARPRNPGDSRTRCPVGAGRKGNPYVWKGA